MYMRVERKKYSGVNMWNKIKSKLPITFCTLVLAYMFWGLYQTDNQFRDRLIDLELKSSHYRTDIIGLKGDIKAMSITITFYKNELNLANELFKDDFTKEIRHEIGLMESKLGRLEDVVDRYSSQSNRFNDSMNEEFQIFITALDTTLQITDEETMKGRQTLQEQINQLRLEFDELIQKLEEHKRTKGIFQ